MLRFRQALDRIIRREDGEVGWQAVVVVIILIAVWQLYPGTILGFEHFISNKLFSDINNATKTHSVPKDNPLSGATKVGQETTTTSTVPKTTASSRATAHHKRGHHPAKHPRRSAGK